MSKPAREIALNSSRNAARGTPLTGAPATFGYAGTAGRAVATLRGSATFNANGPNTGDGVWIGEVGTAELNLFDNAAINIANSGVMLANANSTLSSGTLNLRYSF